VDWRARELGDLGSRRLEDLVTWGLDVRGLEDLATWGLTRETSQVKERFSVGVSRIFYPIVSYVYGKKSSGFWLVPSEISRF